MYIRAQTRHGVFKNKTRYTIGRTDSRAQLKNTAQWEVKLLSVPGHWSLCFPPASSPGGEACSHRRGTAVPVTFTEHVLLPALVTEEFQTEVLNKKYLSIQQQTVRPSNFSKDFSSQIWENSISFNYLSAVNLDYCSWPIFTVYGPPSNETNE